MNPSAKEFVPHRTVSYNIPTNHLSQKQQNIFTEIMREWTTTPILDDLLSKWEKRKGTNSFGGVLIAVHRSIPVQQVDVFKKVPNIIALDIGRSHDKFQLATCYSPPNEKLPIALFNQIMKRNKNTILLGDLNAKHQSWSRSNENQKGHVLFDWLLTKSMTVVNKHVATSTRSNATIDLILAPAQMTGIKTSFSVLPSMGSDHLPVIWIPDIKL
ncbi:unnamed protein product, partial [Rotaria magnacalcarata]